MKQLLIETIRIDGGTQSRAAIDEATVTEYVEAIQAGAKMPPILCFHDGTDMWLAEGFHRYYAHVKAEKRNILAEVKQGTKEDAAWASAGANVTHGLRRTNADKRKAVEMALTLRPDLSDKAIADHCGVSESNAHAVKSRMVQGGQITPPDHRTGVDGKTYKMPSAPPSRPPSKPPTTPPTRPPATPPSAAKTATPPPQKTTVPFPAQPPATPPPSRRPGPQTGQVDETGHQIPDHLIPLWERREEVEDVLTLISQARVAVGAAQKVSDPLWAELNASSAMANLNATYDMIKGTKPHAVCPWCHGNLSDQCRACKGRGMIGSFAWGRAPKELQKGRK